MGNKCLNCESEDLIKKTSIYCSLKCQQEYRWNKSKDFFKQNGFWENVNSETVISRKSKRYILEIRGVKCEICGLKEWMNYPIPLVLDHIDGNSENNDLANLRVVCGNCDMQLPTYKSKNKGKGRFKRRERYKEGKSY